MEFVKWLSPRITEKNCLILLLALFLIFTAWIASVPYDPSIDHADATTNDIWIDYYDESIFHIPYDNWTYQQTQSVVVEFQGEYVVVNEKGPGHVMAILPYREMGVEFLFAPFMMGLAVLSTYMLGKRFFSWPAGFIAALFVLINLNAMVMWHRYYWTDASTMHFLVFSIWLMVEGNFMYNGRSLDPKSIPSKQSSMRFFGILYCIFSGLMFGVAVSTRYPTAVILLALAFYLFGFYLLRVWPDLCSGRIKDAFNAGKPFFVLFGALAVGLIIVLIPLMQYNTMYFGGPFNSGYDATPLMDFDPTVGLDVRNATESWSSSLASGLSNAISNFFILLPIFLGRMPILIFLPLGIYCLRKRRFEMSLLLIWVGINFFTYLSLSWVDMYARPQLVPLEPRYWLPSLPAIALLGGLGIYRLARWWTEKRAAEHRWTKEERRVGRAMLACGIAAVLLMFSLAPAAGYLNNPNVGIQRPRDQPPLPSEILVVTTDQLLENPRAYEGKFVRVERANLLHTSDLTMTIRTNGSDNVQGVIVFFDGWPQDEIPDFLRNILVDAQGLFVRNPGPGQGQFVINVKYGTQDYVRLSY